MAVTTQKKRFTPEESRQQALKAARLILIESGPQAITLKAVAARIERTHANLLHHFGSAADLQAALARFIAETVCATIAEKMLGHSASRDCAGRDYAGRDCAGDHGAVGYVNIREIVDLAFEAFDEGGAGALASWMIVNGNEDALDPIVEVIGRLLDDASSGAVSGEVSGEVSSSAAKRLLQEDTLALVLMAMGDAQLGASMALALGLPRRSARELAVELIERRARAFFSEEASCSEAAGRS